MINGSVQLTHEQLETFNEFLVNGTASTIQALEDVFELNIESSDSSIEIAPTDQNENLKHFGDGPLYIISSSLVGDIQGAVAFFMRSDDFSFLSEVLRPVLSLMFLSESDVSLTDLDKQKPDWVNDNHTVHLEDPTFYAQMMDAWAEMGNIIIGRYSKCIFDISELNSQHSVPLVMKDSRQRVVEAVLFSTKGPARQHLAIENEFFLGDRGIKLWCLISLTEDSFQQVLNGIDRRQHQYRH